MNMQQGGHLVVRQAVADDIPFLALTDYEASLPPFETSFWDDALTETGTAPLQFLEAMLREDASNWGRVEDFIILEQDGVSMAACAVFRPRLDASSPGPLDLDKLDELAWSLSWTDEVKAAFRATYDATWGGDSSFLAPQAEMIIETVGVSAGHRGRGLGHALMRAAFERARSCGASSVGIMVIHGNDPAKALYEQHFEPYATYHPAYFNHEFPGLTKFRATLSSNTGEN